MPTPLGERVREQRRKRGLTLEGLAERVGSSKSYMWEIENKEVVRPSAEKLAMIATAVPVYFLTIRVKQRPTWMIHLTDTSTNWLQRLLLVVPPSKEQ